ncbi:MAG: hypothetical protein LAO03_10095 [Acidobacteriia bacterium]|nr:hypothetical protein [Terriglobia bacterium]
MADDRTEFLLRMYTEMWNNINRHLTVVWQSVGVLAGAFAIFALVEKQTITLDVATALMVVIATWHLGHVYDANTWFNRNLGIIANIERLFLKEEDTKNIQFYFAEPHRKAGSLVSHLTVQRNFGYAIAALVLVYHFSIRILPLFHKQGSPREFQRFAPYVLAIVCWLWLEAYRRSQIEKQKEFLTKSPGVELSESKSTTISS